MSNQLTITGTLQLTPQNAQDGSFPSSNSTVPFSLNTGNQPKNSPADTGVDHRTVASPSAYTTLKGVGTDDDVTAADTLYIRTSVPMLIRCTYTGLSTPAEEPIKGLKIIEVDPQFPLTKVEVKGSGLVEWFASGQQ